MKKTITLLLCLLCCLSISAQVVHLGLGACRSQATLQYNFIGMGNIGPFLTYNAPMQSYAVSAGVEFFDMETFSLSPEIFFYQIGANYSAMELEYLNGILGRIPTYSPEKILINYSSAQLMVNLNTWSNKENFKVQLQLGPRVDLMLKNNLDLSIRTSMPISNIGISGGAGVHYDGFKKIQIGLRGLYFLRVTPIVEVSNGLNSHWIVIKNNPVIFSFSLGYKM